MNGKALPVWNSLNLITGLGKWAFGGGSFSRDVLQATWKPVWNGMKIDAGMFVGNPLQTLSRWTWELPQSLIGYTVSALHNTYGGVKHVSYYGGATVIESYSRNGAIPLFGGGRGVTMGSYIIGERGIKADPTNELFQHEYGHYLQSQAYGWTFMPKFGIPSAISAAKKDGNHNNRAFEQDANARALSYFVDEYGETFAKEIWDHVIHPIIGYSYLDSFYSDINKNAINNAKIKFHGLDLISWNPAFWGTGLLYNNQYEKNLKK